MPDQRQFADKRSDVPLGCNGMVEYDHRSPLLVPSPQVYLTEDEFCSRYHVSPRTAQRWRGTGVGPPWVRLGPRKVAYRLIDCEQWASERTYLHRAEELARRLLVVAILVILPFLHFVTETRAGGAEPIHLVGLPPFDATHEGPSAVGQLQNAALFACFPIQDQSEVSADLRMARYFEALDNVPAWAIAEARARNLRGEVNLTIDLRRHHQSLPAWSAWCFGRCAWLGARQA
jgi:hypothetical protein